MAAKTVKKVCFSHILAISSKLIKQGYRYHKLCKTFSKFYYRHSEFIVCLKTLLQQGISEPVFNGDLVYKFKRIAGKPKLPKGGKVA